MKTIEEGQQILVQSHEDSIGIGSHVVGWLNQVLADLRNEIRAEFAEHESCDYCETCGH